MCSLSTQILVAVLRILCSEKGFNTCCNPHMVKMLFFGWICEEILRMEFDGNLGMQVLLPSWQSQLVIFNNSLFIISQCQYSFGRLVLNFHRPYDLNCAICSICRFWDANGPNLMTCKFQVEGTTGKHGLIFRKVKMTQNWLELVTLQLQPTILELQTIKYTHEFQPILTQIFYKTTTITFNEFIFWKVIYFKNKRCWPGGFSIAKTCNGSKEN